MISVEYSLKCILWMFSIIQNVSYECLYVMNLYVMNVCMLWIYDVYIQYVVLVSKWYLIISNVQYLML